MGNQALPSQILLMINCISALLITNIQKQYPPVFEISKKFVLYIAIRQKFKSFIYPDDENCPLLFTLTFVNISEGRIIRRMHSATNFRYGVINRTVSNDIAKEWQEKIRLETKANVWLLLCLRSSCTRNKAYGTTNNINGTRIWKW